jgi:5-methylcytosine-specific restriction endonuclease McrA
VPRKYTEAKRQYNREYSKRTRERDKARLYAATLKWRKKNWAKHLATAKRYRDKHPDRVKESMRRVDQLPHRVAKREKYWATIDLALKRVWEKNWRQRRKLQTAQNGGVATLQQWRDRCSLYGNCCAYCGIELGARAEMDHVIPVSLGGSGWASNLVPACRSCNAHKHAKRWQPRLPRPKES